MSNFETINPVYHENIIHINNATPTFEPEHFACALEIREREFALGQNVEAALCFKKCLRWVLVTLWLSVICFIFFLFLGGAVIFYDN